MIPALRQRYNAAFTDARYAAFIQACNRAHCWPLDFRAAARQQPGAARLTFLRTRT